MTVRGLRGQKQTEGRARHIRTIDRQYTASSFEHHDFSSFTAHAASSRDKAADERVDVRVKRPDGSIRGFGKSAGKAA